MKKKTLILTTLLCFASVPFGLAMWNQLPELIPTHWNSAGEIDGTMPRAIAMFGLPCFLAAIHLFTMFFVSLDPSQKEGNARFIKYLYWFVPILCNICMVASYSAALGYSFNVTGVIYVFLGLLLFGFGFAFEKVEPNYTMGIRIPWTLNNEENWVRTHRFAAPVWKVGGVFVALDGALGMPGGVVLFLVVVVGMSVAPMVYSFWLHQKQGL